MGTVDCFGQDTCAGCFTYTPWPAKKKSMCQLVIADGIFECGGNMRLPYHRIEILWTVFTGRNNKLILHSEPAR